MSRCFIFIRKMIEIVELENFTTTSRSMPHFYYDYVYLHGGSYYNLGWF